MWPDNKAPVDLVDCTAFNRINYLILKIEKDRRLKNPSGRVLVHCSAGIGRTGTMIALYTVIEQIKFQGEPALVSVFGVVRRLREQRWNAVRNGLQYRYIY